jgi:tRNA G18 (ribose-2'-O)-methylase SpoU
MKKLLNSELNRLAVGECRAVEKLPVMIVLDNIRSQNNIGSVFRTCDAFLMQGICLCGITSVPPHREIQKTALGATESVDWKYFDESIEAIRMLREQGYRIIAIEQAEGSLMLQDFRWNGEEKIALVFGNEIDGVSEAVMAEIDACIEIPQYGTKHSVNISVSAGIVLWHIRFQLY